MAKLVMIGDGPLLQLAKAFTETYGMGESVQFAGIKTATEILSLFESSLAFLQHSVTAPDGDSEGTPVSILEAQASGLPVISTTHAGIPEVVLHEVTGLLSAENDVESMAVQMSVLLKDHLYAKKLGEAGRQRVSEHFTLERHLDSLSEMINDAKSLQT